MIVSGYPVIEDPTNLYYIPVLINSKDRDKVEEALTEYTNVLKCSGRYDEYESFHNCVSMAVNTLRKKYNSKNLIKRGIDTITSFFSVVKDTITHNLRFCAKTVSV